MCMIGMMIANVVLVGLATWRGRQNRRPSLWTRQRVKHLEPGLGILEPTCILLEGDTMSKLSMKGPKVVRSTVFKILAASAIVVAVISCKLPTMPTAPSSTAASSASQKGGTLNLAISGSTSRTLLPSIDMTIASYQVKGTGPNGATFNVNTTHRNTEISGLVSGTWDVTVAAMNAAGQNIGMGSSSAAVNTTSASDLAVTVTPIQGNGTLSLTTTWPAADVGNPSITAELLPPSGSPIPLTYTIGSGTASVSDSSIPNGYYTLSQTLLDGNTVVMGAVEVVRIVAGQTTSGSFDFSNLNALDPNLSVSITPQMANPLSVSLSGVSSSLTYGSTMTVTPSVSGYSGNLTYVYYLNGKAQTSTTSGSPSWTFGTNLAPGNYRLDVTAYTADGLQAGSATANFTVTVPQGTVVLAWNPDSSSSVTGYTIDYGTASHSYTNTVNAGTKTSIAISGLKSGTTYYFAAVADTASGVDSGYSNEVSYTVP